MMNAKVLILSIFVFVITACDSKKTSIAGRVTHKLTGEPIYNAIVNYNQCKTEGDNCNELVIGQAYTLASGEFKIDNKRASKSKKKWITVIYNNKEVGRLDNIGLNDKSISIEVLP